MSKRKILALASAVCMVAILAIGGTLAYFTDKDEATNTFTMGNVKILLDEAPVEKEDDKYVADEEADRVQENEYDKIYPGAILPKDPEIHNIGDSDAYVRVKVTLPKGNQWLGLWGNEGEYAYPLPKNFITLINNSLGENWEIADDGFSIYLNDDIVVTINYTERLAAGETTTPVFTEIYIDKDLNETLITQRIGQSGTFGIDIEGQAIQAEGFDDVEEAFAAFDAD